MSSENQDGGIINLLGENEVDAVKGPRLDSPAQTPPPEGNSPSRGTPAGTSPAAGTGSSRTFGRSRSSAVRFTNKQAAESNPLLQRANRAPIAEETDSTADIEHGNGMVASAVAIQGWRKTMEDHHVIALRGEQRVPDEVAVQRCKQVSISGATNVVSPGTTSLSPTVAPPALGQLEKPDDNKRLVLAPPFEAFIGVYDGHQNANTSRFLKERLHEVLLEELAPLAQVLGNPPPHATSGSGSPNSTITDETNGTAGTANNASFPNKGGNLDAGAQAAIQHAFNIAFSKVDEEHRQEKVVHGGSTVGLALVTSHYILLANLGDCRLAVLTSQGGAVTLEKEHRLAVNEEEKQRVIATGTSVDKDRVGGALGVSRAMGDFEFKKVDQPVEMRPVSVVPELLIVPRTDDQEFVLVGCDGVWELQSVSSIQEQLQGCSSGQEKFGCEIVYRIVNSCCSTSVALTDKSGVQSGCDNVTLGILKLR